MPRTIPSNAIAAQRIPRVNIANRGIAVPAAVAAAGGIPLQAEAAAYFARMAVTPSKSWRDAVNLAIYQWKAVGVWPFVIEGWLHFAETSQAALLGMVGVSDATLTGVPTHTPSKGFSGFGAGVGLNYPASSALLASNNVYTFIAVKLNSGAAQPVIENTTLGAGVTIAGNVQIIGGTPILACSGADPSGFGLYTQNAIDRTFITASGLNSVYLVPGYQVGAGGSVTNRGGTYRTVLTATPIAQMTAYGFIAAGAPSRQVVKFLSILADLIDVMGAQD